MKGLFAQGFNFKKINNSIDLLFNDFLIPAKIGWSKGDILLNRTRKELRVGVLKDDAHFLA